MVSSVLFRCGKAICGGYNALAHAEIVPSAANNDLFATRPTLRELPRPDKWCTDIQSTVHQNGRNSRQSVYPLQ
jgi:hypothetical protein